MKEKKLVKYLIGIDEVGRGPLAGPVGLCATAVEMKNIKKVFSNFLNLTDSKKLSEKLRDEIFILKDSIPEIFYSVKYCSAKEIDKIGISKCIKKCIENCLKDLKKQGIDETNSKVLLDGSLHAPIQYVNQLTIIRGDASEQIISLASVIAKVSRDNHMKKLHKKNPQYNFAQHKGYGTKEHIKSIKKNGFSTEHRKTFCTKI